MNTTFSRSLLILIFSSFLSTNTSPAMVAQPRNRLSDCMTAIRAQASKFFGAIQENVRSCFTKANAIKALSYGPSVFIMMLSQWGTSCGADPYVALLVIAPAGLIAAAYSLVPEPNPLDTAGPITHDDLAIAYAGTLPFAVGSVISLGKDVTTAGARAIGQTALAPSILAGVSICWLTKDALKWIFSKILNTRRYDPETLATYTSTTLCVATALTELLNTQAPLLQYLRSHGLSIFTYTTAAPLALVFISAGAIVNLQQIIEDLLLENSNTLLLVTGTY